MRPFNYEKIFKPKSFDEAKNQTLKELMNKFSYLDLEIGAGVGWHAIQYAKANPDRLLIATERTHEKFSKFQSRFIKHPTLSNLFPVHADVVPWTVHYLPEKSLDKIFIFYPNLYPKNPSARFFKMPFLGFLLQRGKPHLTVHLATNDYNYQKEAQEEAKNTWSLKLIQYQELTLENTPSPRTHFEKKYLLRKEICYDLIFQIKA